MTLAEKRRGIARERSLLVPIIVSPTIRTQTREQARKDLGVKDDEVLLVSVARRDKYRTVEGQSYADAHTAVLRKFPNARLMVVGADDQPDWQASIHATDGRIEPLSPRVPKQYLEAADIYLDSYPFCSATSMMEAAGYGLPCITRFVLPKDARICGMDHPGLYGPLVEVNNLASYQTKLSELVANAGLRKSAGDAIHESVKRSNVAPGWCSYLEAAYTVACALPRPDGHAIFAGSADTPEFGEPDIRIEDIYGRQRPDRHQLLKEHLGQLGFSERLRAWRTIDELKAPHRPRSEVMTTSRCT